jgi:translation initiation factor 2 alpha subunit (eIF-2alpha)
VSKILVLLLRKCLRHNVCEIFKSIGVSEFEDTGSVQISRIVVRNSDMLRVVARYRRTDGAQHVVRVAVNKRNRSSAGNDSM